MTVKEKRLCLNPNHKEKVEAIARGLCNSCYQAAKYRVQTGRTTWEKLEESGRALPLAGKRVKHDSNLNDWFDVKEA
jgi:hypothetical protein